MTSPSHPTAALARLVTIAAGVGALVLTGCGRTSITEPLAAAIATDGQGGAPAGELDEIEFWDALPTRTVVANGDALLGLIFLATAGSDPETPVADLIGDDYAARVDYAKARGWLTQDFNEAEDLAVRRGIIARALADICRVKGGVMMKLLGPTERYSARELEYLGIMPPGSTNQVVAGGEFIGLISQAQDYITYKQFEPLPGVKQTLSPAPHADKPALESPEAAPAEAEHQPASEPAPVEPEAPPAPDQR